MNAGAAPPVRLEGIHCQMVILRPVSGLIYVAIVGNDIGEFGEVPFREIARELDAVRPAELFIDGRETRTASIDVSNEWAMFLRKHRDCFRRVTMLTGSRFVQISADFVRRFADLDALMVLTEEPAAFDAELVATLRRLALEGS